MNELTMWCVLVQRSDLWCFLARIRIAAQLFILQAIINSEQSHTHAALELDFYTLIDDDDDEASVSVLGNGWYIGIAYCLSDD